MLELAGHDSFTVEIRDLLDLQGTFQRSRELTASTKQQKRLLVLESSGTEFLDRLIELEDLLNLPRDLTKTVHNVLATLLLRCTVLAQRQGEHDHSNEL